MTEEQKTRQLELRQAYLIGAREAKTNEGYDWTGGDIILYKVKAKELYPIKTRKPRQVALLNSGLEAYFDNLGNFWIKNDARNEFIVQCNDLQHLIDLFQNPYEEIEE